VQDKVKGILHDLNVLQRETQTGLLKIPEVQQDLKLSEEQQANLKKLLADWDKARDEFFARAPRLSDDARRSQMVDISENNDETLAGILSSSQRTRLQQIHWQTQGLLAFRDAEVVKELKLTGEQRGKIREIERETLVRHFERGPGGRGRGRGPGGPDGFGPGGPPDRQRGPGGPGRGDDFERERMDAVPKVLEILSPEQRSAWQSLVGERYSGPTGFPGPFRGPPP
jgi:hypothetical protein